MRRWPAVLAVLGALSCSRRADPPDDSPAAPPTVAPVARRALVGPVGWGSLRWGMGLDTLQAALEREGIGAAALPDGKWMPSSWLTVRDPRFEGTLYVERNDGLHQVLLFGKESTSDTAGRAALARITRQRGAPTRSRRTEQQRWYNARMALSLGFGESEGEPGFYVSEQYGTDERPERAGRSPKFDTANGWDPFPWGTRPAQVEDWLRGQGIPFEQLVGTGDPGPNAPITDDPMLPSLSFQRGAMHVTASFTEKRGLVQVLSGGSFPTAAEAEKVVADRARAYGPPTEIERRWTSRWTNGPTRVELTRTSKLPDGTWWFSESYTPARE